jgi:hypothetical protein
MGNVTCHGQCDLPWAMWLAMGNVTCHVQCHLPCAMWLAMGNVTCHGQCDLPWSMWLAMGNVTCHGQSDRALITTNLSIKYNSGFTSAARLVYQRPSGVWISCDSFTYLLSRNRWASMAPNCSDAGTHNAHEWKLKKEEHFGCFYRQNGDFHEMFAVLNVSRDRFVAAVLWCNLSCS